MRTFTRTAISAVAILALATPALAGEITGNGDKEDFAKGRSICSFSGLNDGDPPPGRTQSFGQNVRADRLDPRDFDPDYEGPFHPYPGWACNPHNVDLHAPEE